MFKLRIIFISVLSALFLLLTALIYNKSFSAFESNIYAGIARYISPAATEIMITVSYLGSWVGITAVVLSMLIFPRGRLKFGLPIAITAVLSPMLNAALKAAVARDRPDVLRLVAEKGYGFPSGHAMNNAALYLITTLSVLRKTANTKIRISAITLSAIMTASVGVSRVYLGVHNAGDVMAGWIIGAAFALAVDTVWHKICKKPEEVL